MNRAEEKNNNSDAKAPLEAEQKVFKKGKHFLSRKIYRYFKYKGLLDSVRKRERKLEQSYKAKERELNEQIKAGTLDKATAEPELVAFRAEIDAELEVIREEKRLKTTEIYFDADLIYAYGYRQFPKVKALLAKGEKPAEGHVKGRHPRVQKAFIKVTTQQIENDFAVASANADHKYRTALAVFTGQFEAGKITEKDLRAKTAKLEAELAADKAQAEQNRTAALAAMKTKAEEVYLYGWYDEDDRRVLTPNEKRFARFMQIIRNETFTYILRRVGASLITLILLVVVLVILIRFIPDIKLYDLNLYEKIKSQSGAAAADSYRNIQLFKFGRTSISGKRIPVLLSALKYVYYIIPIPKKVPIRWNTRYTEVKEYWTGLVYLGHSLTSRKTVTKLIGERAGISFGISMVSIVFIYLISWPLGIAMAKKPGGLVDKIGNAFLVLNYAIPALVFYLLMNNILGNPNGIFGKFKFSYFYEEGQIRTLVPPVFCLVFLAIPGNCIWVRRFMIDELNSDYVKFARSKGLSENRIMYTHVLRNAAVPLIRNIPATFIWAIVGSYYIETIWGIPGTGGLMTNALTSATPDIPLIQGLTVVFALMSMAAFLLGDIVTSMFDPRIRITAR